MCGVDSVNKHDNNVHIQWFLNKYSLGKKLNKTAYDRQYKIIKRDISECLVHIKNNKIDIPPFLDIICEQKNIPLSNDLKIYLENQTKNYSDTFSNDIEKNSNEIYDKFQDYIIVDKINLVIDKKEKISDIVIINYVEQQNKFIIKGILKKKGKISKSSLEKIWVYALSDNNEEILVLLMKYKYGDKHCELILNNAFKDNLYSLDFIGEILKTKFISDDDLVKIIVWKSKYYHIIEKFIEIYDFSNEILNKMLSELLKNYKFNQHYAGIELNLSLIKLATILLNKNSKQCYEIIEICLRISCDIKNDIKHPILENKREQVEYQINLKNDIIYISLLKSLNNITLNNTTVKYFKHNKNECKTRKQVLINAMINHKNVNIEIDGAICLFNSIITENIYNSEGTKNILIGKIKSEFTDEEYGNFIADNFKINFHNDYYINLTTNAINNNYINTGKIELILQTITDSHYIWANNLFLYILKKNYKLSQKYLTELLSDSVNNHSDIFVIIMELYHENLLSTTNEKKELFETIFANNASIKYLIKNNIINIS